MSRVRFRNENFSKFCKSLKNATSPTKKALWGYRDLIHNASINENAVLLESQQGRTGNGNIFYIAQELANNKEFEQLQLHFVVKEDTAAKTRNLLDSHGMSSLSTVVIGSNDYIRLLATAKYLITDTSFPTYFIKRNGQIVLNTWHGTPLKAMGRKDNEALHDLGNVQKNFLAADYLLYPNEYTMHHMIDDYMLSNLTTEPKAVLCGYPRNTAFFNTSRAEQIKQELGLEGKTIYAYMPTWRPLKKGIPRKYEGTDIMNQLMLIDDLLEDDELLYVNVHPLARRNIYFKAFNHIREFPEEYETYEFLNITSKLVTDYSSVMFDFAISRREIILFDFDSHLYLRNRGLYDSSNHVPFPHAKTADELVSKLRHKNAYDEAPFIEKYCKYESPDSTYNLCQLLFTGKRDALPIYPLQDNGKQNVLIYAGNLAQNGITKSLSGILSAIDTNERNYFLTFSTRSVAPNKDFLKHLPNGVCYIPRKGAMVLTLRERVIRNLYRRGVVKFNTFNAAMDSAYRDDLKRCYGDCRFDRVIQFNGYDYELILELERFNCKRSIYAHNDMKMEFETKHNTRLDVLGYAYSSYDNVAVVSKDIIPVTESIANSSTNIKLALNIFDQSAVIEAGKQEIEYDESTQSNLTEEELDAFLADGKVLISIGRFSPEKQHRLLLEAFNDLWKTHPDHKLLIIGGVSTGDTYQKTCDFANKLNCKENICLIKHMSNPYPALAKCKGFILCSKYEGFGIVLLEATALGIPVVSTNVQGPRGIMEEYGGMLVDNNLAGVTKGLEALVNSSAPVLPIDFDKYNEAAKNGFFSLLG